MPHGDHTRKARASKVHGSSRPARYFTLAGLVLGLGGVAMVMATQVGHRHSLSTTPPCLTQQKAFCTGIALSRLRKQELAGFTKATQVFPSIIEYYQKFGSSFSLDNAHLVAQVNARPFIQINPHGVSMADIAAGKYDSYLKGYAGSIKRYSHMIMLSFGHEFNGNWNTWSLPYTKPQDFVAAWRHMHDIFTQQKVKNVIWTWDFSTSYTSHHNLVHNPGPWWPGTAYVDWIGMDGYMFGQKSFPHKFQVSISVAHKISPKKPVFLAETAVQPGPAQIAGIQALFAGARKYHLKALVWFDVNRRAQWRLEGNQAAAAAFHTAARGAG